MSARRRGRHSRASTRGAPAPAPPPSPAFTPPTAPTPPALGASAEVDHEPASCTRASAHGRSDGSGLVRGGRHAAAPPQSAASAEPPTTQHTVYRSDTCSQSRAVGHRYRAEPQAAERPLRWPLLEAVRPPPPRAQNQPRTTALRHVAGSSASARPGARSHASETRPSPCRCCEPHRAAAPPCLAGFACTEGGYPALPTRPSVPGSPPFRLRPSTAAAWRLAPSQGSRRQRRV